ncbi:MAG: hypothetical protein QW451_01030 [Candidatus Aenigmatarchaeota archaeon]
MEKGQNEIVEHTIVVFLSIILVSSIFLLMSQIYSTNLKFGVEKELERIGRNLLVVISEIYTTSEKLDYLPKENESLKLVEIRLKLPSNVANRNYEISFSSDQKKMILKTLQAPEIVVEIELPNFGMEFKGRSRNGLNSTLSFYRMNLNGEIKNSVFFEGEG